MNRDIVDLARMLEECNDIVFFGGAGVSTESGVLDYRSENGLYNTVKEYGVAPETILSHGFFFEETEIFYDFYRKYFITDARPNRAHFALAELEKEGKLRAVITQNIDGLHQSAGSVNVIELHGSGGKFFCSACHMPGDIGAVKKEIEAGFVPKCEKCGAPMKPRVVLYGEQLYSGVAESAIEHIKNADMLIIGGTSLAVYPAASFVDFFAGKYLVVINKSETAADSKAALAIHRSIGETLTAAMEIRNTMR